MTKIIGIAILIIMGEVALAQQGDPRIDSLKQVLAEHQQEDSVRVIAELNVADAIVYGQPDESMKHADEALKISRDIDWQKGIALAFRQKGNVYYVLSDNLNAMDCFQQALKYGDALKNKTLEATILNNIANIYSDLGEYDKALDYYNQLLKISREQNLLKQQAIALINMGTVYTELKDFRNALADYNEALKLSEKGGFKQYAASILNNMAITYDKNNEADSALGYFRKSLDLSREVANKYTEAASLNGLAQIYMKQGDDTNAEQYSLRSLDIAQALGAVEWQAEAWHTLSGVYEHKQHFDQALNAYKNYVTLRDSVINEEKKSELTKKDLQYQFEKKEALTQATLQRQRLVKNSAIGGALILLIAAITSFIFYKRKRDAVEQKKEAEFKVLVSETEMKALRSQMNPHFIFNSLNSISDYIAKHNTIAADYYLTKFSKVMRRILEHSEQKEISLADELKTLELYIQLELMRLNNKFNYEIRVDDSIDINLTLVPPLILQPFVENSIWHGIAKKEGEGKITINITKEQNMILCTVEDNGIGRKRSAVIDREPALIFKKSLGMKITNSRIDIINKVKKTNAGVELADLEEGLRVQVKLPLELNF